LVPDRARVEQGQAIVEVETSKANTEISAPASGFLSHAHRQGEEVPVGSVLGYVSVNVDVDLSASRSSSERDDSPRQQLSAQRLTSGAQEMRVSDAATKPQGVATRFSQQAAELIEEWGLDPAEFENAGLVRSQDVLKFIRERMNRSTGSAGSSGDSGIPPVPAAGVPVKTQKLSRSKRLEARHLQSAFQNTLPSAVTVRCSAAQLHDIAEEQTGVRSDLAAVIIFEAARLLRKYPVFNAYYAAESVNYYEQVNVGFAIDAGHGLKVPVIRNADAKSVADIASEMRELLVRYLEDKISPHSLSGGTFTITDLSGENVHLFQPLINQGQSAILAICSEFQADETQENFFNLSLVFDHQLSEGRQAARFLNELRLRLEGPRNKPEKSSASQASRHKTDLTPPTTATEETLAPIWGEVFQVEAVGIHDNFLELGGHSLLATELLFRVKKSFQVDLPLRSLFENPTVAALAAVIDREKREASGPAPLPTIIPAPEKRYQPFPLTDVQQAYWIGRGDGFELGNVACHIYTEVDFPNFDQARFELALQRLIQRHDMLRAIVLDDGTQHILKEVPAYRVEVLDCRDQDLACVYSKLEALRDRMSHEVLPTDRWPLFEIRACLLDERRTQLHVSLDLLILDARSIHILVKEFAQLYHNPESILPPLEVSFRDYVQAETASQHLDLYKRSQKYWKDRLPGLPPPPELPLATSPGLVKRPRFVRRTAQLAPEVWSQLKKRAAEAGLTGPGILLAAFAEILTIWSKTSQFTLNLTLFNRLPLHPQVNDIVGDFTSLTMLGIDNSKHDSFTARARRIQEQLWSDLDHRYFTGIRVLRELGRTQREPQQTSMPVVFTSFLNLDSSSREAPGLGKITFGVTQTPQVWLDNLVREHAGSLVCNWDAVEELFPEGMLNAMLDAYQKLLEELAADKSAWEKSVRDNAQCLIPQLQLTQRHQMNSTDAPCSNELLHTHFIKQVEAHPAQTAVRTPQRNLTYAELYSRACEIERQLLQRGVEPNQLIAVMMEKGWEQVVAVLGIHFAGGAYLPIDPDLPSERQAYLLEHGQARIVLTQSKVRQRLNIPAGIQVLAVDLAKANDAAAVVDRTRQKPDDLAYVIYTSGSTGVPKGVVIDHRGAVNTVVDINQRFAINQQDRVLALSRLSFDLSVYDIYGLLAAGGTIVMPAAERAHDAEHWAELIRSEQVTVWNTVPALMQLLVEQCAGGEPIGKSLRLVMMSGDWIPVNLPDQVRQLSPGVKVISLGGATEASIWSILYPIAEVPPDWKSIPYGKPMLNQSFHVLNETLAPCPAWVPGHLYIGGIGLAKGYWRDEQKTAVSFINHPVTGERLYRTGDLGRYLPDGNIEFLGRDDFQVKVQGYRIELGEIEARLKEHQALEACVVVVREDKPREKVLVAYAVLKANVNPSPGDLREHLRARLPEYMVPAAFVFLDHLPLTANGKIDRKALPSPVLPRPENSMPQTVPRDLLELQLTRLWERLLDVHPVRVTDNFFDLGGHSLIALRLFSEVRKLTGRNLSLSTLFRSPTVEKLADVLRKDGGFPSWSSLVPIQPEGTKPAFFCVHGAGGNVLLFRDLARYLGRDYPFYGLQAQGLDGSHNYLRSVEDMAAHYLKEIREVQPKGPYYLGGFCLGGLVAYQMAQTLRSAGEQVALLAMIDSYNFNGVAPRLSLRESVTQVREKIEFHAVNLMALNLRARINYLGKKMKNASARELERATVLAANLVKRTPFNQGRRKFEVFLEHFNEEAGFAYVPDVYTGKVMLFRPQRNYSYLRDPKMGWSEVAAGGLEIIELPVQPGGIFLEPYVKVLADKLGTLIDGALRQADATLVRQKRGAQNETEDDTTQNERRALVQ